VADAIDDLPRIESGAIATAYDRPARTQFQRDRRARSPSLELHSSTRHSDRMLEIISHSGPNISAIPPHLITSGFSSCYSRLAADEPSVTITVNFVHPASNRCIHPALDRALTPREGARLQSFDDDFSFAGNRTQIVKQIGNAVPPLLGQALGTHLATLIGAGSQRVASAA
jgi:DNA (cytosine-5)-methyltransferase 1